MSLLHDAVDDPRVKLFDRLLDYEDFRAMIGGPPPNSAGAKIALVEHLWESGGAADIRRISRRAFPYAHIPEPVEPVVLKVIRALVKALRP